MTILIISLVKIGDAPITYQNNAFFILIMISLFFALELKTNPFGLPELNKLNFTANLVMMITIFGGLFSSINQSTNLSTTIMIVIMSVNIYFLLLFVKYFIQIKSSFDKKFGNFFRLLTKFFFRKQWDSGYFCFFFLKKNNL